MFISIGMSLTTRSKTVYGAKSILSGRMLAWATFVVYNPIPPKQKVVIPIVNTILDI